MKRLLAAIVIICSAIQCPGGAVELLSGTWKLNPAKSKFRDAPPKSEILHIRTDANEITLEREGVDTAGSPFKLSIRLGFGGNLFGVLDSTDVDFVKCWRKDARTVLMQFLKSSVTVQWLTAEAAKDGKTLSVIRSVPDAKGKEVQFSATFDKQ